MKGIFRAITIIFVFFSGRAIAAESGNFKVTGQIRLDHKTTKTKTGDKSKSTGGFGLNRARVVFEGSTHKELSYRIKFYLHNVQSHDEFAADGITRGLAEAKIMHKLSDMLTLELGRLEVNTMSMEGFYSSMDSYSASELLLKRKPASSNGVALVGNLLGQSISLQVVNSPGYNLNATGAPKYSVEDDDMTETLYWIGNIADGLLRPIVSFANITRRDYNATTQVKSEKYNSQIIGVGTGINLSDLLVELEYDMYSNPDYKVNTAIDAKSGKVTATAGIVNLRYKIEPAQLTLLAKYSNDQEKFGDTAKYSKTVTQKFSGGVEFRPLGPNFRYHAIIENSKSVSSYNVSGKEDDKVDGNVYIIGAAASI